MKHRTIIFCLLVLFLLGMTTLAYALPDLTLDSIDLLQGQQSTVRLTISNGTEDYAGVNAKFRTPDPRN